MAARLTLEDRVFGLIRKRRKSSPSPPPVIMPAAAPPQQVAAAQTGSNVDTAIANAVLGNVNTYSPYGSNTYAQTGQTNVDGRNVPSYSQTTTLNPSLQNILSGTESIASGLVPTAGALGNWAQNSLGVPLNFSGVNDNIIQGGPQALQQSATNQIFAGENALLAPTLKQQQVNLQDQLSQQGIPLGSNAYSNAETQLGTQQNQALTAAAGNAASQGITAANNMYNLALLGQNQNITQEQLAAMTPLTRLAALYGSSSGAL